MKPAVTDSKVGSLSTHRLWEGVNLAPPGVGSASDGWGMKARNQRLGLGHDSYIPFRVSGGLGKPREGGSICAVGDRGISVNFYLCLLFFL